MEEVSEDITLYIQDTPVVPIVCTRQTLIDNSEYFRAMLTGEYAESKNKTFPVMQVNAHIMNLILTLVKNPAYEVNDEDILLGLLDGVVALQFRKLEEILIDRHLMRLNIENCLRFWHVSQELALKRLYLPAKLLALQEFPEARKTACFMELNLEEVIAYLGNIYLKTDNEVHVFQAAMEWWFENDEYYPNNRTESLIKLLSCIDFQNINNELLTPMAVYPLINVENHVSQIITCLKLIRLEHSLEGFSVEVQEKARLLDKTRSRISPLRACILGHPVSEITESPSKKRKTDGPEEDNKIGVFEDKLKRKRVKNITAKPSELAAICWDEDSDQFKYYFKINSYMAQSLEGYKLVSYNRHLFVYGGLRSTHRVDWRCRFWTYDSITKHWEGRSHMFHRNRMFQMCLVGSRVFVMGGTGTIRITQENTFWYDFKNGTFGRERLIPIFDRRMKCCSYKNKYLLLSISNKSAHIYLDAPVKSWNKLELKVDDEVLNNLTEFAIFSYKDKLYIKGKTLIELKHEGNFLVAQSVTPITEKQINGMSIALCNHLVYTYYRFQSVIPYGVYALEVYNLETGEMHYIFQDYLRDSAIEIDQEFYMLGTKLRLFSYHHPNLVDGNQLVNHSFI